MTDMVPEKILEARSASFGIGHLLHYHENLDFRKDYNYDPEPVWLFDTIIPPFQRELVWDLGHMARFIESAWKGVDIGRYVVNDAQDGPTKKLSNGGVLWHPTDRWLIDGQQRLTAIQYYLDNQFPIRGKDERLHFWSDLLKADQRKFGNIPFERCITSVYDERKLREQYDVMNFGGVPHRPDQRAIPENSSEGWSPSP